MYAVFRRPGTGECCSGSRVVRACRRWRRRRFNWEREGGGETDVRLSGLEACMRGEGSGRTQSGRRGGDILDAVSAVGG